MTENDAGRAVSLLRVQRFLQQHDEVELSALGLAIATVVTVAEILKNNGLVVQKRAPCPLAMPQRGVIATRVQFVRC